MHRDSVYPSGFRFYISAASDDDLAKFNERILLNDKKRLEVSKEIKNILFENGVKHVPLEQLVMNYLDPIYNACSKNFFSNAVSAVSNDEEIDQILAYYAELKKAEVEPNTMEIEPYPDNSVNQNNQDNELNIVNTIMDGDTKSNNHVELFSHSSNSTSSIFNNLNINNSVEIKNEAVNSDTKSNAISTQFNISQKRKLSSNDNSNNNNINSSSPSLNTNAEVKDEAYDQDKKLKKNK